MCTDYETFTDMSSTWNGFSRGNSSGAPRKSFFEYFSRGGGDSAEQRPRKSIFARFRAYREGGSKMTNNKVRGSGRTNDDDDYDVEENGGGGSRYRASSRDKNMSPYEVKKRAELDNERGRMRPPVGVNSPMPNNNNNHNNKGGRTRAMERDEAPSSPDETPPRRVASPAKMKKKNKLKPLIVDGDYDNNNAPHDEEDDRRAAAKAAKRRAKK